MCPIEEYLNIFTPFIPSDEEMNCLFDNVTLDSLKQKLEYNDIESMINKF